MSKINPILIPNITSLPDNKGQSSKTNQLNSNETSEFKNLLEKKLEANSEIQFSTHASKRLKERNIDMDTNEYLKLQEALQKLKNKGGKDSLVITPKAAYVLDVDRSVVVTAMDKESMNENVFTKIDSTLFIN